MTLKQELFARIERAIQSGQGIKLTYQELGWVWFTIYPNGKPRRWWQIWRKA